MKKFLLIAAFGLFLAGCSKDNPVSSLDSSTTAQTESLFSLQSMQRMVIAPDNDVTINSEDLGKCRHDSTRNQRMLDSLKIYLQLTDAQVVALKAIGQTLFTTLKEIRQLKHSDPGISSDSVKVLIGIARDEFIASVKLVLTDTQLAKLQAWINLYWDKPFRFGGDDHGHGGHDGEGGHGGHGGDDSLGWHRP